MKHLFAIGFLTIGLLVSGTIRASSPKVVEQVVLYQSVGPRGDTLLLSGWISVPVAKQPKGLILLAHYTIGANDEAPSMGKAFEARYFRNEYILVMPDYIGFGSTRDRMMPYLDGALTARNCIDMLQAATPLIDSIRPGTCTDSIYVCGFSQGGAVALWITQLIEAEYADRWHIKKCFAGSGPYDVATTYDVAVNTNKVGLAMSVPLLILGTDEAYDLHLERDFFFTPELIAAYEQHMVQKNENVLSLALHMNRHRLDYWMTAQGRDKTLTQTQRLYTGFMRSSLVHFPMKSEEFAQDTICPNVPKTSIFVFHSTQDDVVDFQNAAHLYRCWSDAPNIRYDFGRYGNHLQSLLTFYSRVNKQLKMEK